MSNRIMLTTVAIGVWLVLFASPTYAQTKTITGETHVVTGTVEAIEAASRVVTIKGSDGIYHEISVPEDTKQFSQIKVGDTITARYYENIVLRLKKPGEPSQDTASGGLTPTTGTKPGGTAASQRTITATIDAIDPDIPSIKFKGPNGWEYSSRVEDRQALAKVKVGDKVDITWTTALLVSLESPKK